MIQTMEPTKTILYILSEVIPEPTSKDFDFLDQGCFPEFLLTICRPHLEKHYQIFSKGYFYLKMFRITLCKKTQKTGKTITMIISEHVYLCMCVYNNLLLLATLFFEIPYRRYTI